MRQNWKGKRTHDRVALAPSQNRLRERQLLFSCPDASCAATERDGADWPQLAAVKAEHLKILFNHTPDHHGRIVLAPGCTLAPMANARFSNFPERRAVDRVDLQ